MPPHLIGHCSLNAVFASLIVTARPHFPGNLIFGPIPAALTPPASDLHIDPAADALNVVFPRLFQFKETGQAELTFHDLTPSRTFSNAEQRQRAVPAIPLPGGRRGPRSPRFRRCKTDRSRRPQSRTRVQGQGGQTARFLPAPTQFHARTGGKRSYGAPPFRRIREKAPVNANRFRADVRVFRPE